MSGSLEPGKHDAAAELIARQSTLNRCKKRLVVILDGQAGWAGMEQEPLREGSACTFVPCSTRI
jgi:hypothetical protein